MANFIKKYKLNQDIDLFKPQIYELISNKKFSPDVTLAAPDTYWTDLSHYSIDEIINIVESSIQQRVQKNIWFWDYKSAKDLHIHIDDTDPIDTVIVPILGSFELSIWDDELGTNKLESVVYHPGDIISFSNSTHWHSGKVLTETRQSLHLYLEK